MSGTDFFFKCFLANEHIIKKLNWCGPASFLRTPFVHTERESKREMYFIVFLFSSHFNTSRLPHTSQTLTHTNSHSHSTPILSLSCNSLPFTHTSLTHLPLSPLSHTSFTHSSLKYTSLSHTPSSHILLSLSHTPLPPFSHTSLALANIPLTPSLPLSLSFPHSPLPFSSLTRFMRVRIEFFLTEAK